jgi:hypothetical protein
MKMEGKGNWRNWFLKNGTRKRESRQNRKGGSVCTEKKEEDPHTHTHTHTQGILRRERQRQKENRKGEN